MKSFPPYLIVHTNAAYSRLSGIDSHSAVGKPVSSLLSLPEQGTAMGKCTSEESPRIENSIVAAATNANRLKRESQVSNHQEAEAAGRARAASAEDNITEVSLERLVAASGYGKHHPIKVLSKPQNMLGRNVTVTNPPPTIKKRSREEGSNGSSITSSNEGSFQFLKYNMSISPIVSSPESFNVEITTEKDRDSHHHKAKRRKHHPYSDALQAPGHRKRQFVTHYVIQLEKFDDKGGNFREHASQSSASTKSENKRLRQRQSEQNSAAESGVPSANNGEDNEPESGSDQREAIVAIG